MWCTLSLGVTRLDNLYHACPKQQFIKWVPKRLGKSEVSTLSELQRIDDP